MREKEAVKANFVKMKKGDFIAGIIGKANDGGTFGPSYPIHGAAMWIGKKYSESEEMRIGENRSLQGFRLGDEEGNLVLIGCKGEQKTQAGMMRVYRVLIPESLAEVLKFIEQVGGTVSRDLLTIWSGTSAASPSNDPEGDDDLPF